MQNEKVFLAFTMVTSVTGAVALGIVVKDWWFSAFIVAIFAIPLALTAINGAKIIRNAAAPAKRSEKLEVANDRQ